MEVGSETKKEREYNFAQLLNVFFLILLHPTVSDLPRKPGSETRHGASKDVDHPHPTPSVPSTFECHEDESLLTKDVFWVMELDDNLVEINCGIASSVKYQYRSRSDRIL